MQKADPEYRRDPITGRWVIIAPERAERPIQLESGIANADPIDCPFCEGREHETPPELFAVRPSGAPNSPGWQVRVVPNKYPAVRSSLPFEAGKDSLLGSMTFPGFGHHEVILHSPKHVRSNTELSVEQLSAVLAAYRESLRRLGTVQFLEYASLFHNFGPMAGASQDHLHSQILATQIGVMPPLIQDEFDASELHYQEYGSCKFCDMIEREKRDGSRIIAQTPNYIALCPYASRFPYEIWIFGLAHEADFRNVPNQLFPELADLLRTLLRRLEWLLVTPAYNYFLHTAPFRGRSTSAFHWHLEITPRILGLAGFELGGGIYINPIPPELAACQLRHENHSEST